MDIFKKSNMQMANSLDWNANHVCKRRKGDTRLVHKKGRAKLKTKLKKELEEYENENSGKQQFEINRNEHKPRAKINYLFEAKIRIR